MSHNNLADQKTKLFTLPVSKMIIVVAIIAGIIALAVVLAGLTLPIPGTQVVTDPRELFTTVGAALSGPIGGVIIGILAGIAEPGGIWLASILAHVMGGIWMGFAYKKLVHEHLSMPGMLLGWAGLVLAYYFVFVLPGFIIGLTLFYGEGPPIGDFYSGAAPEAIFTTVVTTLVMLALPVKYRRPLW